MDALGARDSRNASHARATRDAPTRDPRSYCDVDRSRLGPSLSFLCRSVQRRAKRATDRVLSSTIRQSLVRRWQAGVPLGRKCLATLCAHNLNAPFPRSSHSQASHAGPLSLCSD